MCDCDDTPAWADRVIETPGYYCTPEIWHTAENVAVSGLVEIDSDATLIDVRNTGAVEFTAGSYQLWARRIPN